MAEIVTNQLVCLIVFTITGISIGILFDLFRILRKSFKTNDFVTYLQDILFWILAGIILLFTIFKFNNGEIRSYVFIGIALGVVLYLLTISKYFIKYSVIIVKFLKKVLSYPIHLIQWIFKKIFFRPIHFITINLKNISLNLKTKKDIMKHKVQKNDNKNSELLKKTQ